MGKILLVEPSRILRQAISLFLFPENEVHAQERITDPKTESLEGYDLLILDGPELRDHGWWSAELEQSVQSSGVPVLWLEDENGIEHAAQGKHSVLKKPVVRDTLRTAAGSFLSADAPQKKRGRQTAPREDQTQAARKPEAEESPPELPQQGAFQFIDLVDEVEEEPTPAQPKTSTTKSK